ncbi:MAG TPA: outer membrane protein assembly factor BamD [Terriglobales bacterium]|jgi:outer membrane protein assembly factor BamD|nr:outer membrane protein assembly factor BamD [Terriglobales bacterium]
MIYRFTKLVVALSIALMVAGCHHNKVANPIANVDSKQPDKVLFDRAMEAMKKGKYDVARITLQTLINTYPDSEFIARAKLAVGDSWYAEGTTAAYQQAEVEYKDFQTFFPNLPEAAEAQLKVANMHYKQMEKPDRDYTHAMRAEDEYRAMIQQYPDHKLIPEAKQRLREVQEVLAERQYRIGRFYYLRESYPAAVARLKSLADTYPLYSQADDVLMMLGRSYEAEAGLLRTSKLDEQRKVKMIKQYDGDAGKVYARIIERYPTSDHAGDAQARLKDLGLPVPTPTPEAIAQYKAEEQSRSEMGRFGKMMSTFHKAPDNLARAAKVGEPPLVDPAPTNAPQLIREAQNMALGVPDGGGGTVSVEKTTNPDARKSDPIPRSEAAPNSSPESAAPPTPAAASSNAAGSDTGIGELTPNAAPAAQSGNAPSAASAGGTASAASDASSGTGSAPPAAPAQVNEIEKGSSTDAANASSANSTNDQGSSSSKKKKKTGLKKIVPF